MSYTIKEVSDKFQIPAHTLRYYEKEGLIPFIHRNESGRREYSESDLVWIQMVTCMRATGMSIEYIKKYNDMTFEGEHTIPKRRQMILQQKEILENHIKEFQVFLDLLDRKLVRYDEILDGTSK